MEGIANGTAQLPVYEVGVEGKDTFTFVNNGIKLFSVKLKAFGNDQGLGGILNYEITNFSMPATVGFYNYFNVTAYNATDDIFYRSELGAEYKLRINEKKESNFPFYDKPSVETITHFYIGIPNNDSSRFSIIPYAIFKLPSKS